MKQEYPTKEKKQNRLKEKIVRENLRQALEKEKWKKQKYPPGEGEREALKRKIVEEKGWFVPSIHGKYLSKRRSFKSK